MKMIFSFTASVFMSQTLFAQATDVKLNDTFIDKKTGDLVYLCSIEGDSLMVGQSCGKFWEKTAKKRTDLVKKIEEYNGIKKNDPLMMKVDKKGDVRWTLVTVSDVYEDGTLKVMEFSSHHGVNPGTINWSVPYSANYISKKIESKESSVCAKEAFEIVDGNNNEKTYKIEKDEKLTIKEIFENGQVAVALDGFFVNLLRYGHNNKLAVPASKLGPCSEAGTVSDSTRAPKPMADEGATTPARESVKESDTLQR